MNLYLIIGMEYENGITTGMKILGIAMDEVEARNKIASMRTMGTSFMNVKVIKIKGEEVW